jgi:hypothetical protein
MILTGNNFKLLNTLLKNNTMMSLIFEGSNKAYACIYACPECPSKYIKAENFVNYNNK